MGLAGIQEYMPRHSLTLRLSPRFGWQMWQFQTGRVWVSPAGVLDLGASAAIEEGSASAPSCCSFSMFINQNTESTTITGGTHTFCHTGTHTDP